MFVLNRIILIVTILFTILASSKIWDFEVMIVSILLIIYINNRTLNSWIVNINVSWLHIILKWINAIRWWLLNNKKNENNYDSSDMLKKDELTLVEEENNQEKQLKEFAIDWIIMYILQFICFLALFLSAIAIYFNL